MRTLYVALVFLVSLITASLAPTTVQAQAYLPRLVRSDVPCAANDSERCDVWENGISTPIFYYWFVANRPVLREQDFETFRQGITLDDITTGSPLQPRVREGGQALPSLVAEHDQAGNPVTEQMVSMFDRINLKNIHTGQGAITTHCHYADGRSDPYPRFREGMTLENAASFMPAGCEFTGGVSLIDHQLVYVPRSGGFTIPQQLDHVVAMRQQALASADNHGPMSVAQVEALAAQIQTDRQQFRTWQSQRDVVFSDAQTTAFNAYVDAALDRLSHAGAPATPSHQEVVAEEPHATKPTPTAPPPTPKLSSDNSHKLSVPEPARSIIWWVIVVTLCVIALAGLVLLGWYLGPKAYRFCVKMYRKVRDYFAKNKAYRDYYEASLEFLQGMQKQEEPAQIGSRVGLVCDISAQIQTLEWADSDDDTSDGLSRDSLKGFFVKHFNWRNALKALEDVWGQHKNLAALTPQSLEEVIVKGERRPVNVPSTSSVASMGLRAKSNFPPAMPPANDGEVAGLKTQVEKLTQDLTAANGAKVGAEEQVTQCRDGLAKVGRKMSHVLAIFLKTQKLRLNEAKLPERTSTMTVQDWLRTLTGLTYVEMHDTADAIMRMFQLLQGEFNQQVPALVNELPIIAEDDTRVQLTVNWLDRHLLQANAPRSLALEAAVKVVESDTHSVSGNNHDSWGISIPVSLIPPSGEPESETRATLRVHSNPQADTVGSEVIVEPQTPLPTFGDPVDPKDRTEPFITIPRDKNEGNGNGSHDPTVPVASDPDQSPPPSAGVPSVPRRARPRRRGGPPG